jgi:hypothetical protein
MLAHVPRQLFFDNLYPWDVQEQSWRKDSAREGVSNSQLWLSEALHLSRRKCLVANSGEFTESAKLETGVNKANSNGIDGDLARPSPLLRVITADTKTVQRAEVWYSETQC